MGSFSIWHWLIVLVIVLLLFGRGKIPELMGDVAKGIKNFKQGMSDEDAKDSGRTIDAKADETANDVKKTTKSDLTDKACCVRRSRTQHILPFTSAVFRRKTGRARELRGVSRKCSTSVGLNF